MTVSQAELAEVLGINARTVQRLTQEGAFKPETDPTDKRKRVFDLAACVQSYIGRKLESTAASKRSERLARLEEKKMEAEAELKESQRDLHQLRTAITAGEYLHKEQVQADYERFFVTLRQFCLALPPRVAGRVAGQVDPVTARGIEQDLHQEVTQLLRSFVVAGNQAEKE